MDTLLCWSVVLVVLVFVVPLERSILDHRVSDDFVRICKRIGSRPPPWLETRH